MVAGSLLVLTLTWFGMSVREGLLLVTVMCLFAAWLAWKLHLACD
jgi:hypothetical protein